MMIKANAKIQTLIDMPDRERSEFIKMQSRRYLLDLAIGLAQLYPNQLWSAYAEVVKTRGVQ